MARCSDRTIPYARYGALFSILTLRFRNYFPNDLPGDGFRDDREATRDRQLVDISPALAYHRLSSLGEGPRRADVSTDFDSLVSPP